MKSIIKQGPVIGEAYDTNTKMTHAYFGKVKEWVAGQAETIEELDMKARSYGKYLILYPAYKYYIPFYNVI